MQQRAAETRQAIIEAAADLFARDGYRATGLRDIVNRASVTQGAFYFHFDSKNDVAEEIIRQQHATSIATTQAVMSSNESGLISIVRLSDALAEQVVNDATVRAGLRLSTENADELSAAAVLPYRDWLAAARVLLERARMRGELREGLDLDTAAELVIGAFSGTQFLSAILGGPDRLRDRLNRMWRVLFVALTDDVSHPVFDQLIPDHVY
ncbi:ScbR family autoregulator-binding transcription factor [Microbacterium sp. NPDC058389]|uniref:ScbR family autoregulator-binding transcription factor n=1 Tax=Microbacterium sp. NPDC058389 TaxID=3346475 RepID=UPI003651F4FE